MLDAFAECVDDLGAELILSDVDVLQLVEALEVLEERAHGRFVLNHVTLESEGRNVLHLGQLFGELHGGLS